MSEVRSILAATDFSVDAERATRRAALLARILGARLELLHVVSGAALANLAGLAPSWGNVGERLLDDARRMMDAATASLPDVVARVETGDLPGHILQAAASHDLLVLGARGMGSLEEASWARPPAACSLARSARSSSSGQSQVPVAPASSCRASTRRPRAARSSSP